MSHTGQVWKDTAQPRGDTGERSMLWTEEGFRQVRVKAPRPGPASVRHRMAGARERAVGGKNRQTWCRNGQPPSLTARGGDASFSEQDGKPRVHPIHFKRKCTPWLLQGDQIVAKTTQMQATPQSCSET